MSKCPLLRQRPKLLIDCIGEIWGGGVSGEEREREEEREGGREEEVGEGRVGVLVTFPSVQVMR